MEQMKFKPVKRHPMDDGSLPVSHFLEVSEKLVESIRNHPNSSKQQFWRDLLNECGEILRFRFLEHKAESDFLKNKTEL